MPSNNEREQQLFHQALRLKDSAQRTHFLAQNCSGDTALKARIESLLETSDQAESFFEFSPASTFAPKPAVSGKISDKNGPSSATDYITQIGRYHLLDRIGEGGYGLVYLAEQLEPVRRQVALKIIRLGMDTEKVINQFEAERQALALMEHPYIARVLDAGATDSGRPFFVMECVEGIPITRYCDEHRFTIRQRLELFIKVCHAIQHAHQKGVIHRDIKPSNILVTTLDGEAVPKVIDFGIAKATGYPLTDHTLTVADLGQFIGSPSYMSPEHVRQQGLQIDTRSDIFSLGVLLCELLIGRLPYHTPDWTKLGLDEIRREIETRESRPPSHLLRNAARQDKEMLADARHLSPSRLEQTIAGDLDWITLTALARERERRYETASSLAIDVQRYLSHDIVFARPPSKRYRLGKFVRRNKGPVIAGSLVLSALVLGLGTSTHLYFREQNALETQIRLQQQTEEARRSEALLRKKAEVGEAIARAAVQISYKKLPEADALVKNLNLDLVQPSLESALVFETLGIWHAKNERWSQAARYLTVLAYSITTIDPTDTDGVSRQLLPASTVIVKSGDLSAYDQFRNQLLHRFGQTSQPIVAEQILKSCLLTPATPEMLALLKPLSEIVEKACQPSDSPKDAFMTAWQCFALSLMKYREADFAQAIHWSEVSMVFDERNESRFTANWIIMAMSYAKLGQAEKARDYFSQAEDELYAYEADKAVGGNRFDGFWYDWINNQLLLEEARTVLRPP